MGAATDSMPGDAGADADASPDTLPPGGVTDMATEPRSADDPPPAPDLPPTPDDGSGGQAAAARGGQDTNTVGPASLDPIIDPPVRIIFQWKGAWSMQSLRPKNQLNGCYSPLETGKVRNNGDPNDWADNGCYPVCFAMAVRWWCEDFPTTKGNVVFPTTYKTTTSIDDPRDLCKRFSGAPFVPCQTSVPMVPRCGHDASNPQPNDPYRTTKGMPTCNTRFADPPGACPGCQTDLSSEDPGANKRAGWNTYTVGDVVRSWGTQLTFEGQKMTYERWKCGGLSGDEKKAKLKAWLAYGPIMVNMIPPGHWVLVTGYRNGIIYICDPGAILTGASGRKWLSKSGSPRIADSLDTGQQGYLTLSEDWMSIVYNYDKITFPTAVGEGENASWFQ